MKREFFLLAGEASGDARGAELMRALKVKDSSISFCGMGGLQMREEGMEILADLSQLAVVGIVEVLKHYCVFKRTMDQLLAEIQRRKPRAVIGIDYPGFNLRLLEKVRHAFPWEKTDALAENSRSRTRVIQYISPQLWAWDEGRKWDMARYLDLVLCIFPFEPRVYEETKLKAEFVGHPLIARPSYPEGSRRPSLVAFFPGSREKEIRAHMGVFAEVEARLKKVRPTLEIAYASSNFQNAERIRSYSPQARIEHPVLLQDTAAAGVVCSGTATLEAALAGLPMCVVYRVAWPTYWMGRFLIKVPFLAMPNLLAGRALVQEFIQSHFTADRVFREVERLLDSRPVRDAIRDGYHEVRSQLGASDAAQRAACEILRLVGEF